MIHQNPAERSEPQAVVIGETIHALGPQYLQETAWLGKKEVKGFDHLPSDPFYTSLL